MNIWKDKMDNNKLKKLEQEGYIIHPCCNFCVHSYFATNSEFGVCQKHTYKHLKHVGEDRQLSISRFGLCDYDFELDNNKLMKLNTYDQFFYEELF